MLTATNMDGSYAQFTEEKTHRVAEVEQLRLEGHQNPHICLM